MKSTTVFKACPICLGPVTAWLQCLDEHCPLRWLPGYGYERYYMYTRKNTSLVRGFEGWTAHGTFEDVVAWIKGKPYE